jgi:hypothetical protein
MSPGKQTSKLRFILDYKKKGSRTMKRSRKTEVGLARCTVFTITELVCHILHFATNGGQLDKHTLDYKRVNRLFCELVPKMITLSLYLFPNDRLLWTLPNLTELNLYDRRITPVALAKLTRLTHLRLRRKYDSALDANKTLLQSVPHLRTLEISGTDTMIERDAFTRLTRLDSLVLEDSFMTANTISRLCNLTRLEILGYSAIADDQFVMLTGLRSLSVCNARYISGCFSGKTLHTLTSLTELSVKGCVITAPSITCLTQLQSLKLHNTPGISFELILSSLPKLTHFKSVQYDRSECCDIARDAPQK